MRAPTSAPADPSLAALPASLQRLAARGILRRYKVRAMLIEEGTPGDTLLLICAGRVKACSIDNHDREIVYGVYGPGDYVGEMSLDGGPRSASVIALEPTTCVLLTRAALLAHIAEQPEFAFELLSRVIQRARRATDSARSMALLDVYGRLARLLDTLAVPDPADPAGNQRVITERMTHAEMAARIGCSREMVTRLLKDLQTGGYIRKEGTLLRLCGPLPPGW